MKERTVEEWQRNAVIEAYHSFSTKCITFEMLKLARQKSFLGYGECKKIIEEYIDLLDENG